MMENEEEVLEDSGQFEELIKLSNTLSSTYYGYVVDLKDFYAKTKFTTSYDMAIDEEDLVFNGFIASAANYAALLAINLEFLVTVSSKINFLAPARVGDIIIFEAKSFFNESKKREVKVLGTINEIKVFEGTFQIVTLEEHIFSIQRKELEKQNSLHKATTSN